MACNSRNLGRAECYFHICDIHDQKSDSGDTPCIVLEFGRYRHPDGQVTNKTVTWHGPFAMRHQAEDLIAIRTEVAPKKRGAPTAARKGEAS